MTGIEKTNVPVYPESPSQILPSTRHDGGGKGVPAHLAADHDVGDLGLAVAAVRLVVAGPDGQNEVARVALALPHQEAAVLALLRQQLLRLSARQVTVEPPAGAASSSSAEPGRPTGRPRPALTSPTWGRHS